MTHRQAGMNRPGEPRRQTAAGLHIMKAKTTSSNTIRKTESITLWSVLMPLLKNLTSSLHMEKRALISGAHQPAAAQNRLNSARQRSQARQLCMRTGRLLRSYRSTYSRMILSTVMLTQRTETAGGRLPKLNLRRRNLKRQKRYAVRI